MIFTSLFETVGRYGRQLFCWNLLLLLSLGCSTTTLREKRHYIPQWTKAFSMPSLLDTDIQETLPSITTQEDITSLLSQPWYGAIEVKNARDTKTKSLRTCANYFANKAPALRALRDREQSAFRELQIACEASRLLAEAKVSTHSFIPTSIFTASAPTQMPKSLGFVTSQKALETIQLDSSKKVWSDVNRIRRTERVSELETKYYSDAGVQTLFEIGRGDFNDDATEDILILSQDTVTDGSYFHLRLFVFSIDKNIRWTLVEQY